MTTLADRLTALQLPCETPLAQAAISMAKLAADASTLLHKIQAAAKLTDISPSPEQIEAGNYRKGKVNLHGLTIAIENPQGSVRSGTSKQGRKWQTTLTAHYGYILGTRGADKDHLDVFIGPDPTSTAVYIVNQLDPTNGSFDEHKVVLGCGSERQARRLYLSNYQKGWQGLGSLRHMTVDQFKRWLLEDGPTKKADIAGESSPVSVRPDWEGGMEFQLPVDEEEEGQNQAYTVDAHGRVG